MPPSTTPEVPTDRIAAHGTIDYHRASDLYCNKRTDWFPLLCVGGGDKCIVSILSAPASGQALFSMQQTYNSRKKNKHPTADRCLLRINRAYLLIRNGRCSHSVKPTLAAGVRKLRSHSLAYSQGICVRNMLMLWHRISRMTCNSNTVYLVARLNTGKNLQSLLDVDLCNLHGAVCLSFTMPQMLFPIRT